MSEERNLSRLIETTIPILSVKDIARAISYYERAFKYKRDWVSGNYAQVSRDGLAIMFREDNEAHPQEVWIGTEEIDELYEALKNRNVTIVQEPRNDPWAYHMRALDLDGNILWFGTAPMGSQ